MNYCVIRDGKYICQAAYTREDSKCEHYSKWHDPSIRHDLCKHRDFDIMGINESCCNREAQDEAPMEVEK